MYMIYHFILTIIASGVLLPILGWKLILFWLGSFFIDVDHYWRYILKFKRWNLKEAYNYGKNLKIKDFKLHILHTIEFWILIGIGCIFSKNILITASGLIYHNVIDLVYLLIKRRYDGRALSFLEWCLSSNF